MRLRILMKKSFNFKTTSVTFKMENDYIKSLLSRVKSFYDLFTL